MDRVLLFKIVLAPLLVAAVTLAGRKWGPAVAGWLLGLPLTSGPVLLFLALEQGPQFASQAARAGLLGLLAWAAFTVAYAYACVKLSWWKSALLGWLAYFVVAALLLPITLGAVAWFLVVCLALAVILLVFPPGAPHQETVEEAKNELWWRMGSATVILLVLTGLARVLGPTASGILTMFPAYTTILAVFTHRQQSLAAVTVLKGVTTGLFTPAVFCVTLALTLPHLAWGMAFSLALLGALLVQAFSLLHLKRSGAKQSNASSL
ncbi:MAG TPA: hypothetical protein VN176_00810 [Verrucomicrobiae bacterium]|jgi:hypothetical protein|nr:hypothetical protein [Verrucomicrobiae bacterium]